MLKDFAEVIKDLNMRHLGGISIYHKCAMSEAEGDLTDRRGDDMLMEAD